MNISKPRRRAELAALVKKMGVTAHNILREKEKLCDELNLKRADITQDELLNAMAAHPVLINRPIVESDKQAMLCRPAEKVKSFLASL